MTSWLPFQAARWMGLLPSCTCGTLMTMYSAPHQWLRTVCLLMTRPALSPMVHTASHNLCSIARLLGIAQSMTHGSCRKDALQHTSTSALTSAPAEHRALQTSALPPMAAL